MTGVENQIAWDLALEHQRAGRLAEAEAAAQQVLNHDPTHAGALRLLGVLTYHAGRLDAAIGFMRRSIAIDPRNGAAHSNLGVALLARGEATEAIACHREALACKPDQPEVHNNLGNALSQAGRFDEAMASYRRAIELNPRSLEAHNNLGYLLKEYGRLDEAIAVFERAAALGADSPAARVIASNLLFTLQFHPKHDAKAIGDTARRWNERYAAPLSKLTQPHSNDATPGRRLRIGYVSPNWCDHCQSFFTVPLLSSHDHERFEIVCYSDTRRTDSITDRLRGYGDQWRHVVGLSDEQLATQVRDDRIDILVDLTMHMAQNRLLVFARKPAPVQVSWLAYPGTTGLSTIDYRLTDPHLAPAPGTPGMGNTGVTDSHYSEESIHLPDSFWCYDPLTNLPAVNPLPALRTGHVTFGCLNNLCKVNDGVLRLWAHVLARVESSRLLLLAPLGTPRRRVLDVLNECGVAPQRVEFADKRPRPAYLELYHRIDIGLDTFPYNGHTTSLDAYWMGVPVVTLVGQTVVGRAGLSQLTNLGLPELVARTPEEFVNTAAELAGGLPGLGKLRATLRERLRSSPLMDAPRFTRNMEAAYRMMWRRWCERQSSPAAP